MTKTLEEVREAQRERNRKWWAKNAEKMKAIKATDEYKAKRRAWSKSKLTKKAKAERNRKQREWFASLPKIEQEELRERQRYQARERQREIRGKYLEWKATLSCERCGLKGGGEGHMICFHHRDPSLKESTISALGGRIVFGTDKFWDEVNKCSPLCHNCHAHLHWLERQNDKEIEASYEDF